MLTPKTRISTLQAIAVIALITAGCGSPRTTVSPNADLDEAVAFYINGDLERAEALFARVASDSRGDEETITAWLYLGRIYLARGDYERAADAFSTGRALGGDIRFTEYFEEAQRHLFASPQRIIQLPRVTRGQLAALIESMFGHAERGDAPPDSQAVAFVLQTGVMTVLPDGDFHREDAVTRPSFYAISRRLAGVVGADADVVASLFPGGVRGTVAQNGWESRTPVEENLFVSGRDVHRVLVALAEAVHPGDE